MTEEEDKQYEVIDGIVSFTPDVFKRKKSQELQDLENQLIRDPNGSDAEDIKEHIEIIKRKNQHRETQAVYYEQE